MASRKGRRNYSREFKAKVARDAMRDVEPTSAVARRHGVHPNQVREWRSQAEAGMASVFGPDADAVAKRDATIRDLHAKIGELTMEKDFFCRSFGR